MRKINRSLADQELLALLAQLHLLPHQVTSTVSGTPSAKLNASLVL